MPLRMLGLMLFVANVGLGGAVAQQDRMTVTVKQPRPEQVEAAAAQEGPGQRTYVAPELQLVRSLDVRLVGITDDGKMVYSGADDARRELSQHEMVREAEEGAGEYSPPRLIVGYTAETKDDVRESLESSGYRITDYAKGSFFTATPQRQREGVSAEAIRSLQRSGATSITPDFRVSIPPRPEARENRRTRPRQGAGNAAGDGDRPRGRSGKSADRSRAQKSQPRQSAVVPNDYDPQRLWGLAYVNAPKAWDCMTGSEVIVAVIDSGVDYTHEDLQENMWTDSQGKHGYDFANDDDDPMDDNLHGTHCAGTIAAVGNNGHGIVGVQWTGKIMALKFLDASGSGATSDAIRSIDWAVEKGARVLNNSWGGGGYSPQLKQAIDRAEQEGVLFIAAAGNDNVDNEQIPHYPSSYPNENIIAVAAHDTAGDRAWFSCWGADSVDLAAPGVDIYSTVPEELDTRDGLGSIWDGVQDGFNPLSGTSMATPHVSGACALVWATDLGMPASAVRQAIRQNLASLPAGSDLNGKIQWNGTLELALLCGVGPGQPPPEPQPRLAWSSGFAPGEKTADQPARLLSLEIELPRAMEVHIQAATSAAASDNPVRLDSRLEAEDQWSDQWRKSFRYTDLAQDTWTGVSNSFGGRLPAGTHVIHWIVSPQGGAVEFDGGTMLIQAFAVSDAGGERTVRIVDRRRERSATDERPSPGGGLEDYPDVQSNRNQP